MKMAELDMKQWITLPPKYTIFRLNVLKKFDINDIKHFLEMQRSQLKASHIPKLYFLHKDCIVIEQWSSDIIMKQSIHEVIVDASCAAAVLRGSHVFAAGVMGLPVDCELNEVIDIYGDIEGQCKRGLKVKYNGKKQYVGTGYLKMLRKDLFDNGVHPSGVAVHTLLPHSRLPVINETMCTKGTLVLQNLPSIVCGWVVNAQPEECILDMCAAPGNKTTHLAEMSNNKATIIALDKTLQKVNKIQENCNNHGVTCVSAYVYDSTKCCSENSNTIAEGPPFPPKSFDKVLLDGPCSGLGQRPQLVNRMSTKMLQSYKFLQRKLFAEAVKLLKVGGRLVYSTCTVTKDENEGIVAWAIEKFPSIKLVPAYPLHGGPGLLGCGLNDEERQMVQRFGPGNDPLRPVEPIYSDSIGFFIAAFTKINE